MSVLDSMAKTGDGYVVLSEQFSLTIYMYMYFRFVTLADY